MLGAGQFISTNLGFALFPAEVRGRNEQVGCECTAGEFATTRAMTILEDSKIPC